MVFYKFICQCGRYNLNRRNYSFWPLVISRHSISCFLKQLCSYNTFITEIAKLEFCNSKLIYRKGQSSMIGIYLAKNFSFWHLQISGSRKLQLVRVDNISLISDWQVLPLSVKCYCIISLLPLRKKEQWENETQKMKSQYNFMKAASFIFVSCAELLRVIWAAA